MNHELKSYASTFTSFLLDRLGEKISDIEQVILYGSVARGTAGSESDVDIFVDTAADIGDRIDEIIEEFYDSRWYTLFKTRGMGNDIEVKVGKLEEWEELHRSIISTGIVLWGRFRAKEKPVGTEHGIIFFWDSVGRSRSSFLNKLYGFTTKGEKREGLLDKWGGSKTGKSSVLVPIEHREDMLELIEKYKVNARNVEVFVLE